MSQPPFPARRDGAARIGGTGKHLAARRRRPFMAAASFGAIALLFTVLVLNGTEDDTAVEAGPVTSLNLRRITFAAQDVIESADPSIPEVISTSGPGLTTTTTAPPPPTTAPPTTAPPTTEAPTTTAPPTTEAPTTTRPPTTTTEPAPPVPGDSVWDRLADCEAGGNWHINTGNGYYGGLQFSASSWRAVGGTGLPHQHSRETQIEMGKRLQARQGWGAWPSCSRKLGLR